MVRPLPGEAGIAGHALEHDAAGHPWFCNLLAPQVTGDDLPHRLALLRIDRGPAGDLIPLAGLERPAIVEREIGNAPAHRLVRRARVAQTADANHVAALLVVRIGI